MNPNLDNEEQTPKAKSAIKHYNQFVEENRLFSDNLKLF